MESNTTRKHGRLCAVVFILLVICAILTWLAFGTNVLSQLKPYLPQVFVGSHLGVNTKEPSSHSEVEKHADHSHSDTEEHADHSHCDTEEHADHLHDDKKEAGHEGHNHEVDEQANANRLALDDASLFNIGIMKDGELTLKLQEYQKTFRMPGVVREIPGRSINSIAATVSGIVTKVEAKQGDSLCPGAPLLEIQLTHAEAIQCQTEMIALLQKQDVIGMEEERLSSLAEGIAPKQQRELLLQKISNEAAIQSQKNLLKIHGFTDRMIAETVVGKRQTITTLVVRVPEIDVDGITTQTKEQHSGSGKKEHYQILEKLLVNKGDSVRMGDILCQISDLRTLQVEGFVFASSESIVNDAFLNQSPVAAIFADAVKPGVRQTIEKLKIARVDSYITQETQTVSCWINLANRKLALSGKESGSSIVSSCDDKTISWRFKPGQRCELAIGYETIKDCFVLPPEAVATDRSHAFVFELTDIHEGKKVWTKKSVRILYRANDAVVIASDETIHPGMKVAKTGADQLYVALGSGSGKLQSACGHDH